MSNQKGCKHGEKSSDKQMQARNSRQDEYSTSVNKGLMVYANKVASDMVFSFLKTMNVEKKGNKHAPACLVLKTVVLKHTRDVISDLIDSIMKNLHSVTGELMTDSGFVVTMKKNLFSVANQKSTEILEAMVKRLFQALAGEDKGQSRSQSLAFTSLKTGSQDPKSQAMQFTAMQSAMHNSGKDKDKGGNKSQSSSCKPSEKHCSMDKYAKDLIVTALMLIQQHLLQQTNNGKDSSESHATSFGYVSRDAHFEKAGNSQSSKSLAEASGSRPAGTRNDYQQHLNSQKGDISSVLLSIIQKVLHEAGFNTEDSSSETNKSLKHTPASEWEPGKQAIANQLNSTMEQSDNMDQVNKQFFDQLVESVIKLCLFMVKGSGTDIAIGDLSEEPNAFGTSSAKAQATARRAFQ
ncbi:PREDICTED: A-kinase anchor protein 4-like [Gavialis gangeticus]|uniref:A-kinase anchor protein 4-like n=1 Tax=Gavialis gangeticus TaxID=94835 RepID=UPI00092FC830|nr:PREDICTED: A-kinase anchor protein 4-like [Gavialis gangeticus]